MFFHKNLIYSFIIKIGPSKKSNPFNFSRKFNFVSKVLLYNRCTVYVGHILALVHVQYSYSRTNVSSYVVQNLKRFEKIFFISRCYFSLKYENLFSNQYTRIYFVKCLNILIQFQLIKPYLNNVKCLNNISFQRLHFGTIHFILSLIFVTKLFERTVP